jgi:hypothetical protein
MKTMAALAAMLAVASGQPFLDRKPSRPGSVLYVAEEGGRSKIADRFRALLRTYSPIFEVRILHREGITFQNGQWDLVRRSLASMHRPVLVVLDTYARLNEKDENGSAAAHDALSAMSGLTAEFEVDNVLIHHTGHDGSRLRGHSSLKAGVDGTVLFKRHGKTNRVDLDAETKDSDPETLSLEWDAETFLLHPREGGTDSRHDGLARLLQAVDDLGGRYGTVRTSALVAALGTSRQWVQELGRRAVQQGLLLRVSNGPHSGYRLPPDDEPDGSSPLQ